jgi:hypothetical protein
MRLLLITLFFLYFGILKGQGQNKLELVLDSVNVRSSGPEIQIRYSVTNGSESHLVLYRLGSDPIHSVTSKKARYCDPERTGAGVVFFIYNENRRWMSGIYSVHCDFTKPMTGERLDSIMTVSNANSLAATSFLKAGESRNFEQIIDLAPFSLTKGRYYVELLYHVGYSIEHFVDDRQQSLDKRRYGGDIFFGCVSSDLVTFVVE